MTNAEITSIITTFIQNLPAILTATASVISALVGLLTILVGRRGTQKQDKQPPSPSV